MFVFLAVLQAGACVCIFQAGNFTGWGSEGATICDDKLDKEKALIPEVLDVSLTSIY